MIIPNLPQFYRSNCLHRQGKDLCDGAGGLALAPSRPNSEPELPREGGTESDVIVVGIIRTNPITRDPSPPASVRLRR